MVNLREVSIGNKTLKIYEHEAVADSSTGKALSGAWLWDCSLVLTQYLAMKSFPPLDGKLVVELGAGTGLPGLAAAALGAEVTLTDKDALLAGLERNIEVNELGSQVQARTLEWGGDCSYLKLPVDIVLGSDIMYDMAAMPDLCKTLSELSGPETLILLAYELRAGTTDAFKLLTEHGLQWSKVPEEELHPDWQSDDIGIFRVRKV